MEILNIVIFFIIGTIFGSFFNVVGLRVPQKQSIVYPGSSCRACHRPLQPYELIPILSYIFLKGRCRTCGSTVSISYPLIEGITGIGFVWSYLHFQWTAELLVALVFLSLLVIITVSDLHYMIIPNVILGVFALIFVALRFAIPLYPWWDSVIGALVGFCILYVIAIASKGGMGGGDIKLYAVIGIVVGVAATILSLFIASVVGLVYGLLYLRKHEKKKGIPIPFGPAIAIGAWLSYLYSESMLSLYLTLFEL